MFFTRTTFLKEYRRDLDSSRFVPEGRRYRTRSREETQPRGYTLRGVALSRPQGPCFARLSDSFLDGTQRLFEISLKSDKYVRSPGVS